jgi:hypothetical protein
MFDLESAIKKWKTFFNEEITSEDIDEMECHLKDNIDFLLLEGKTIEKAFNIAVNEFGNIDAINGQFHSYYEEVFMDFERKISDNMDNPESLEDLYHQNPYTFKKVIERISIKSDESMVLKTWKARLFYKEINERKPENFIQLIIISILSIMAGITAWIPKLLYNNLTLSSSVTGNGSFYTKNICFFIIFFIMIFFIIKYRTTLIKNIIILSVFLLSVLFINLIPSFDPDHTKLLSILHMPLFLWLLTGVIFTNTGFKDTTSWIDFLKFSGEFFIYSVLLYLGFGVLSFFTISIFNSINLNINDFYSNNISIIGFVTIPVIASYLALSKRDIVQNMTPVLAKIFSPLFLIVMIIFIFVLFFTGKNPYDDREFLIVFNFMLLMVLALVFFVITERNIDDKKNPFDFMNILLIISAIIINVIALSAIIFRLSVWGFSANKAAVFGENIILMINLCGLLFYYIKYMAGGTNFIKVELFIAKFLAAYFVWFLIVIFIFPFIFKFN